MPLPLERCRCPRYVADMSPIARFALTGSLACLLGACAGQKGDYPSLAIRDAERVEGQFDTGERARLDVPPVEVDLTGGLEARLAGLVDQAERAHAEFLALEPRVASLVAAAGSRDVASNAWAAAQVALAELDSARSRAAIPLGDLDTLYTAANVAAEDVAAIEAARREVISLIERQDAVLAELRGNLS